MKKLLSLFLAAALMMSMLCIPAAAQGDGQLVLDRRENRTSDPQEMVSYRQMAAEACGDGETQEVVPADSYEDAIYLVPDFVNSVWQNGDIVEIAIDMFCYSGKGNQKFYINIYDDNGDLLGWAEDYFPNTTGYETVFFTWSEYPAEGGTYWIQFYSDYTYDFADSYFPFYIVGPQEYGRPGWTETPFGWGYYLSSGECAMSQWLRIGGSYYYFDDYGLACVGWQNIAGDDYYFYDDGTMASSTWVDGFYLNEDGVCLPDGEPVESGWQTDGYGWWYVHEDGGVTTNDFEKIDGSWFYFDSVGYMVTGWMQVGSSWYYFGADGVMATGWQNIDGYDSYFSRSGALTTDSWVDGYYLDENGICVYGGWVEQNGNWYYLDEYGVPVSEWQNIDGNDYYFGIYNIMVTNDWVEGYYLDENGVCVYGRWIELNGEYAYFDDYGRQVTGWQYIDGSWYWFNDYGLMYTGWFVDMQTGLEYYFCESGEVVTGWQNIDGKDYYFYEDGSMARSAWVDGCYLDFDGVWDPDAVAGSWGQDEYGWWYQFEDGTYAVDCCIDVGGVYYCFDSYGYLVQ